MIICHCQVVSDQIIRRAAKAGARSVQDVAARCGAGRGCGSCHGTIKDAIHALNSSERARRDENPKSA